MSETPTEPRGRPSRRKALTPKGAARKQASYRQKRREWAYKVGRPYPEDMARWIEEHGKGPE